MEFFLTQLKKSGWISKMGDERVEKIKVDSSHETRVWKGERKYGLHLREKHKEKLQEAGLPLG